MVMAVGQRRAAGRKPVILTESAAKNNSFLCPGWLDPANQAARTIFSSLKKTLQHAESSSYTRVPVPAVILVGPTAAGKTALSLALARRFACEIVGLDSMQVYRHMDIGTAKATREEQSQVAHHLLDIVNPDEEYHVARYLRDVTGICTEIAARGRLPLLVGGTGLYLKALQEGLFEIVARDETVRAQLQERFRQEGGAALFAELTARDPGTAARIHVNDRHRLLRALEILQITGLTWSEHLTRHRPRPLFARVLKIGVQHERAVLYERINLRVRQMADLGLLAEVKKLLDMGYGPELKAMQAIGYYHMLQFLNGTWSWDEALSLLARDTRRYAKRQLTWFGGDTEIHWADPLDQQRVFDRVAAFLDLEAVPEEKRPTSA